VIHELIPGKPYLSVNALSKFCYLLGMFSAEFCRLFHKCENYWTACHR